MRRGTRKRSLTGLNEDCVLLDFLPSKFVTLPSFSPVLRYLRLPVVNDACDDDHVRYYHLRVFSPEVFWQLSPWT